MAEDYVENGLEFLGHATGKHFDSLYDKVIGKPKPLPQKDEKSKENDNYDGPFREKRSRRNSESYATYERGGVRSSSQENYVFTRTGTQIGKHRNTLPSPEPAPEFDIGRGNLLTERSLRKQEQLLPPKKNLLLEKGLPPKEDLLLVYKSKSKPRRDSAMASGYRDDYRESGYRGDNDRPRSQPPRGRYYDDEDSDYDERSGDRYRGGGRGWDDRDDYDTVKETREVYRGPAANRPWGPERNESGRSDYSRDGPYGSGAVAQYGRRSDGNLDRPASTYLSRREKSRGRDSYRSRSRSYSRSSSRSRSRSASGIRGKLEDTFSTSKQGIAAGLAGAVIGGLAGREIGKGQHRNRDAVIGAVVGGLAANAGEHKWREYKNNKERDRDLERYERPYDGRSRSNMR